MADSRLRIKELCKERGITQAQLAERLGIKPTSFSQAITRNKFDLDYLERIAKALNVEVVELFDTSHIRCPKCGYDIKIKAE